MKIDTARVKAEMLKALIKQGAAGNASAAKEAIKIATEMEQQHQAREPSREEVEGWMINTGSSYAAAATHFHPEASTKDRERFRNRYKKWKSQLKKPRPALAVVGSGDVVHLNVSQLASMPRIEAVEAMIGDLGNDINKARALKQVQLVVPMLRFQKELLDELWAYRGDQEDSDQSVDAIIARIHQKTGKTGTGP